MARFKVSSLFLQAVAGLAIVGMTASADAGWWHHGSSGGSSGGWGSSGGSSGGTAWGSSGGGSSGGYSRSWGSSGGSSGGYAYGGSSAGRSGGLFHHHRRSYGSSGGWGGSGGSSGGYYGGSSGGSSGGTMYYAPMESGKPAAEAPAAPAPAPPAPDEAPAPKETSLRNVDGMLAVEVPADARIFVNGQETSSTGAIRQYISRNLQPGYNYTYEVRAEIVRDGKTVADVKTIDMKAGEVAKVAFNLAPATKVETSLTVRVPANAKVYLAGNPTKATGETRVFRTTSLTSGKSWNDYTIKVEIEKDGKTVTREEKISLGAGETKELTFDFDSEKVADAR